MKKINFAGIIVTYRCNAGCYMCHTWQYPSKPDEEIDLRIFERLPKMDTVNVTGGEPFVRTDIEEIVAILRKRCNRLVISSNGYFTDRILELFRKRQDIGIRISIEGLPKVNDELRGIPDGFDKGIRTLIELAHLGVKDIGFGITVSDRNAKDMLELYHLSRMMKVEFATAAIHNSYYFHKYDNRFEHSQIAIEEFNKLIGELLTSHKLKDWFRAYFNYGLINYIKGNPRLLPCEMGSESFFLDPYGEIRPCNVMEETMGNLKERSFDEIWSGSEAVRIRDKVRNCRENCWMIGNVSEIMKKNIAIPIKWIIKTKFLSKRSAIR